MTTEERQKIEGLIAQAETALHKLMMGSHQVKVGYDGTTVEYNRTSVPELRRYIATLKRQVSDGPVRPGSQRVTF